MLPLKLKICGFLSYLHETEIDFTKFGAKGLYLITGDTGAGKTTIFDAISYALYGKASGDKRETRLFRSKNAAPDIPTYVELTFMSKGKKYTVRRNPEYEQSAKKGGGTSVCKPKVLLTTYDGDKPVVEELKKEKKSGNNKDDDRDPITKIVGIDSDKFRQLSMIAQGAFDQVITANTKQRTEILRAIFNTENYEKLQNELAKTAENYRKECTDLSRSMSDKLMLTSCQEDSQYKEKLDEIKSVCADREYSLPTEEILSLLSDVIAEDDTLYTDVSRKIEEISDKLEEKQREIGTAEERESKRNKYLENKNALEAAEKLLPEAEKNFRAAEPYKEQASELQGETKLLQEKLPLYDELQQLVSELNMLNKRTAENKAETAMTNNTLELMSKQYAEMCEERDRLKDCEKELVRITLEQKMNEDKRTKLREHHKLIKKYQDSRILAEKKKKSYEYSRNTASELRMEYDRINNAYLDDQAGYIAETLEEGKPCPVCGSLSHPCRAVKRPNAPSKEDVDNSRKASNAAEGEAVKAAAELRNINDICKELKAETDELSLSLLGEIKSADELMQAVISQGVELKNIIDNQSGIINGLNKKKDRKDKLDKSIPEYETNINRKKEEIVSLNTDLAVLEQKKNNTDGNISKLRGSLPFATSTELKNRIAALNERAASLTELYAQAEKSLAGCKNDIARYKAALEAIGEIRAASEADYIKKLREEAAALKNESGRLSNTLVEINSRVIANNAAKDYIIANGAKLEELREYYIQANELSITANGKLTEGQEKLNLEVYAQAKYFEGILALSNIRLMKMSNNKYEFRRAEESLSKKGQFGLEIDVIDHDSATRRSVRSLSGGESFMASLALALGFSDTIQTTVGGVQLETIFIDEGFGTLDGKKLENTYGIFNELGTDGKCLVGIISHVEELKKRIPNRIIVTKDSDGNSHAKIETDF